MPKKINPVHPGEILHEEFLRTLKVSQYRLAKDIGVAPRRINEIIHGVRANRAPDGPFRIFFTNGFENPKNPNRIRIAETLRAKGFDVV